MLTIFAIPKPFLGHIGLIQRNAIASWVRLNPSCQVILFGNEEGTALVAKDLGVEHVPDVATTEHGTPLISDLFRQAERLARHGTMCFANSDIVLLRDCVAAVKTVTDSYDRFLMIGECMNLDVEEPIPFDRTDWEAVVRAQIALGGKPRGPRGIDYFVFSKGLYGDLPPFAVGRPYFDSWLVWKARNLRVPVVDATTTVMAVHQNHNYGHVSGGKGWVYDGPEALRNLELAGGAAHVFLTLDASHILTSRGFARNWGATGRIRYCRLLAKTEGIPLWRIWIEQMFWRCMEATRPFRHALGLSAVTVRRVRSALTRFH